MNLKIISKSNTEKGSVKLPSQFNEPVRLDLIRRAVITLQANKRQPYGANPEAGKRASAYVSKRRHAYKSTYGIGQSRTPRKVMSFRGTRFNWVGAFAPQTVGGRRAHPPKAEKIWAKKLNTKERRKAIRSAMAATINKELVKSRGHKAPDNYPFIISNDYEEITKTKELAEALKKIGLEQELKRGEEKKVRPGKGKTRGRKYKEKKSLLIVTAGNTELLKAANNLPGVDAVSVDNLNAELLAPGAMPGRLTLYTEGAIQRLEKEQLYTNKPLMARIINKAKEAKETIKQKTTKKTKEAEETKKADEKTGVAA